MQRVSSSSKRNSSKRRKELALAASKQLRVESNIAVKPLAKQNSSIEFVNPQCLELKDEAQKVLRRKSFSSGNFESSDVPAENTDHHYLKMVNQTQNCYIQD